MEDRRVKKAQTLMLLLPLTMIGLTMTLEIYKTKLILPAQLNIEDKARQQVPCPWH
jgi:hypothetical protein